MKRVMLCLAFAVAFARADDVPSRNLVNTVEKGLPDQVFLTRKPRERETAGL